MCKLASFEPTRIEDNAYESELPTRKLEGKVHSFVNGQPDADSWVEVPTSETPKNRNQIFWGDGGDEMEKVYWNVQNTTMDAMNYHEILIPREYLAGSALQTIECMPLSTAN